MKKTLVASLLLAGCGDLPHPLVAPSSWTRVDQQRPDLPGDDRLAMAVEEFYSAAKIARRKTTQDVKSVSFTDDLTEYGERVVGVCLSYSGSSPYKEVRLQAKYWSEATDQSRRALVFHELGHCALELDHVEVGSGAIMEPYLLGDTFSSENWYRLVQEELQASALGLHEAPAADDFIHISL